MGGGGSGSGAPKKRGGRRGKAAARGGGVGGSNSAEALVDELEASGDAAAARAARETLDEYYALDYEDVLGHGADALPTRFKYRAVDASGFGIDDDELVNADEKELSKRVSVRYLKRPYGAYDEARLKKRAKRVGWAAKAEAAAAERVASKKAEKAKREKGEKKAKKRDKMRRQGEEGEGGIADGEARADDVVRKGKTRHKERVAAGEAAAAVAERMGAKKVKVSGERLAAFAKATVKPRRPRRAE